MIRNLSSLFLALLIGLSLNAKPLSAKPNANLLKAQETWLQFWRCRGGKDRRYSCLREVFASEVGSDEYLKYDFLFDDSFSEVEILECPREVIERQKLLYKTPPTPQLYCFAYSRNGKKRWARVYFKTEKQDLRLFSISM